MTAAINNRDWSAVHDHMPGKEKTLRVDGIVDYPTTGFSAWLEPSQPQGFNDRILEMDLHETAPADAAEEVITPVPVHYEKATEKEYDQVNIRTIGVLVEVEHPQ